MIVGDHSTDSRKNLSEAAQDRVQKCAEAGLVHGRAGLGGLSARLGKDRPGLGETGLSGGGWWGERRGRVGWVEDGKSSVGTRRERRVEDLAGWKEG